MAKTEIFFVSGLDPVSPVPKAVKAAGLGHRFAVVQESHQPDAPDMVFDEALKAALLRFLARFGEVTSREDRVFLARRGDALIACMAFEDWAAIGGPAPYHDSYTYALYTSEDIGARVMAFLASQPEAANWSLAAEAMAPPVRPKSLLQRLMSF
jgi:hypothetical protein